MEPWVQHGRCLKKTTQGWKVGESPSSNINFISPMLSAKPCRVAGSCEVCQGAVLAEGLLTSSSSSVIPSFSTLLQPQETEARARRVWLTAFARAALPCRPPSLPSQRFPSAEDLALTNWVFGESGDREGSRRGDRRWRKKGGVLRKRRCFAWWNAGMKQLRLHVSAD